MIEISDKPRENGSAVVTIGPFHDENGDATTPTAIRWSLTNRNGVIINEREHISVTPDGTVKVLLEGDDLQVGNYGVHRRFIVRALYDSTLGDDIPLVEQAEFEIERTPVAA